jgi:hypothetical protein
MRTAHIQRMSMNAHFFLEIGATENYAAVHRAGAKNQIHLLAGVQG